MEGKSTAAFARQTIESWARFSQFLNPVVAIVVAWALLTLPLLFFRGYNSDEGVAVTIARTALEDGDWLTPHMFNYRFVERPTLLSWIIAAISAPFGNVSQFTARLPIALFLLGGCLLIYMLLRRVAATPAAALLGAALFFACPLVVKSYVMITADMPLAVLLFLAFVLWWDGHAAGAPSVGRWISIGVVLALCGLMKGPQPIAYFALGVGLFLLGSRSWKQIPGLMLSGAICVIPMAAWYWYVYVPGVETQWAAFMRFSPAVSLDNPIVGLWGLAVKTLPVSLLAGAFLISEGFRSKARAVPPGFISAIACYGFAAAVFVLFWPGGSATRYFFPLTLPMCVLGGLAYDALAAKRPQLLAAVLIPTFGILAYGFAYSAASPLLPKLFRSSRIEAALITGLVNAMPGPIYRTGASGLNVLPYVPMRILAANLDELETINGPAWIAVTKNEADMLIAKRGGMLRIVRSFESSHEEQLLYLDR